MDELTRLFLIMVNQSLLSRFTVTESMAKFAMNRLAESKMLEKHAIRIMLAIEEKFRDYYENQHKEVELQRIAAQTLEHLIRRYMIATHVDASCVCPQIYEIESEEAILNKYHMHYQVIAGSNKSQRFAIQSLRPYVLLFRQECAKLNLDEETPLIMGDTFHKPITFFMELVEVLFNFFYTAHLQLDCAARLLDPSDLESLKYYQKLLAPNEEFDEYFMHNISYCKCLRAPTKCLHKLLVEERKSKDIHEPYISQAKKARCARRVAKRSFLQVERKREESAEPSRANSELRVQDSRSSHDPLEADRQQHERDLQHQLRRVLSLCTARNSAI